MVQFYYIFLSIVCIFLSFAILILGCVLSIDGIIIGGILGSICSVIILITIKIQFSHIRNTVIQDVEMYTNPLNKT